MTKDYSARYAADLREQLTAAQAEIAAIKAREVGYIQAMDAMGEETAALRAEREEAAAAFASAKERIVELEGDKIALRAEVDRLREALKWIAAKGEVGVWPANDMAFHARAALTEPQP